MPAEAHSRLLFFYSEIIPPSILCCEMWMISLDCCHQHCTMSPWLTLTIDAHRSEVWMADGVISGGSRWQTLGGAAEWGQSRHWRCGSLCVLSPPALCRRWEKACLRGSGCSSAGRRRWKNDPSLTPSPTTDRRSPNRGKEPRDPGSMESWICPSTRMARYWQHTCHCYTLSDLPGHTLCDLIVQSPLPPTKEVLRLHRFSKLKVDCMIRL